MNERRTYYFDWMLTWHQSAAELRQFELGGHFRDAFQTLRRRLRRERLDLSSRQLTAGVLSFLVMGLIMVWMIGRILRGISGLGDAALFYQVLNQGQRLLRSLLGSLGESNRNVLFLENLFEVLVLEPAVRDPASPVACPDAVGRDIRLEGVTFRYPGSDRAAIEDFHLTLPAGKIVALVGENGAGKSTVIKLLCRFYDPETGRILVDGTDVRTFALADWRRRGTVLFQEPVHYHETAAENILFGDLAARPGPEDVKAAARAGGADAVIERLPKGYDTILGKWFGGAELSVGEWQRISLARAFLRRASIVILDEPTSAMDSWAEADWMTRFWTLVAGRTALIITHRFTTALRADVIHVMSRGKIIESGAHAELLAGNGAYARSWRAQTKENAVGTGKGEAPSPTTPGPRGETKDR
jgi:ATP-binding cassette subfamily B protein